MILVYKYHNRKLYSPTLRKFLKREDLFNLVETKTDFRIIDHKTKNVITEGYMRRATIYQEYQEVYRGRLVL